MVRVEFQEALHVLTAVLGKLGFTPKRAELSARLFVEASCDGVYSHGLHRFPRFVTTIRNGTVRVDASPEMVEARGAFERWNGNRGPGNLNAYHAMARAIALAREHSLGCVALAGTNHWMRGGTYGCQAADAGAIALCWTNTLPNLPPWGASVPVLGNNPMVIAVPRAGGHLVLDMAMSQFSYGTLESYRRRGELLPVEGGFDRSGRPTRDPAEIEATQRLFPIGYWKGSGLALMLDLMAGILSGGLFTHQIEPDPDREVGVSQVFIAFDSRTLNNAALADTVLSDLRAKTSAAGESVRYPGEHVLAARKENLALGVPVDEAIWKTIQEM
jgi:3-dehydro-L-gulonate 2-dehydrogenase